MKSEERPPRWWSGLAGLWLAVSGCVIFWPAALSAETFIVGTQNVDYYPHYAFADVGPNGPRQTYARAVFEAFAAASGHQFEFIALPTKRLHRRFFEKHRVDFLYPDNRRWTPELKADQPLYYSEPLAYSISGTLVRREDSALKEQQITRLATVRGFTPAKWRRRQAAGLVQVVETSSVPAAIQLTLLGRTQGCDIDYSVANYHLDKMNRPGSLVLNRNLPHAMVGFHLASIKHPVIIEEFNTFLANNSALLRQLRAKFGIEETMPTMP